MLSDDRRREIATFLRSRRERLQPEQVELPRGTRRRTPGLRREEVATLADVSTEWYTWLEQAREVQASADVLRRIAGALRLEPGESFHLLTLAGYGTDALEQRSAQAHTVSPRLQQLLEEIGHCPAWVHGERWDFLVWNDAAKAIHGDLDALQGIERNVIYQAFMNPRMREMLVNWEQHARDCVARLRGIHARNVDDPWFNELIHLLEAQSPEFSAWWSDHNVQLPRGGTKRYRHPGVGMLTFDVTMLDVVDESVTGMQLITYVAKDAATRRKMADLLERMGPNKWGAEQSSEVATGGTTVGQM